MAFRRFSHLGANWHVSPDIDDVRGFRVFDNADKPVGIVDDLLVDDNNAINYVLIGQGNIATMLNGKELIAPLGKLAIDANNKSVRLDINFDQLWDFPPYNTLDDPDLKENIDSFWASIAKEPFVHDVTLRQPASMESPVPIPSKVEPSKMPAGNPRIVAGLESPISEEVIEHAVAVVEQRESTPKPSEAEKPEVKPFKPESEEEKIEHKREKPAA